MRRLAAAFALAAASLAGPARAGAARCWVDDRAVVVAAAFGDITGDFLLDLAAPKSVLHVDRALGDGITTPTASATLRLAGARIPATLTVASLDARSIGLPTTINGLIGADVLKGYVVDLHFSPCRIALWRGRAPRFRERARAPVSWIGGAPTVPASITDGRTALAGAFAIDTGAAAVRVSSGAASLSRAPKGVDPTSRLHPPARLAALGLSGAALTSLPASLARDLPPGVLGSIGTSVWARYAVRLDLSRGVLELGPPPAVSGRRRARASGS